MFLGWTPVSVAPWCFDSRVQPQGPGRSLGVGHLTENRLPRSGFAVAARGNAPNEELRRSFSRCLGGFTLQGTHQKICWVFFNWEVFKVKTSMVFKKLSPTCIETFFNWLQKMMSFFATLSWLKDVTQRFMAPFSHHWEWMNGIQYLNGGTLGVCRGEILP